MLKTLLAPALLILAVLGSILAGIATPTESAGLGALVEERAGVEQVGVWVGGAFGVEVGLEALEAALLEVHRAPTGAQDTADIRHQEQGR